MNPLNTGEAIVPSSPGVIHIVTQAEQKSSAAFWGILIILITSAIWAASFSIGYITSLTVLIVLGLVLALIGIFHPVIGLFAIGLLSALDSVAAEYIFTGGWLRYNTVNYFLLIVMVLYLPFLLRLRDLSSRLLQLFLLLLLLYLSFSPNKAEGVQGIINITTTFGLIIFFARGLKDEKAIYWLGIVIGTLGAVSGLVFFLQVSELPYADPNNWTYTQLTALFAIYFSFNYAARYNKNKLILFFLAVVNFAWIFLSGSRGSLLIAILCVVFLFLSSRSITWSSVMVALAIVVTLWISAQFIEQQVYTISRLQLLFDTTQTETRRTSQRSVLMQAGWELFKKNPLGTGTGSFRVISEETTFFERQKPAHSAWIKTLVENGIPGILLLSAFVASFTLIGLRNRGENRLLFGIFITMVFAIAFIAKEFQGKSLWFLAAAGIVLLNSDQMLEHLDRKIRPYTDSYRERLREVRFGQSKQR